MRTAAFVSRAGGRGEAVHVPHKGQLNYKQLVARGAYYPPTVVCCEDPNSEIVQVETFGPIMVVQRANDWNHAMQLCNGVRQGLAAALFSGSKKLQEGFLEDAQAGVLKLNCTTAGADAESPFGGWKASGVGPPEHGASDREFYTRTQAVYGHAL